MAQSNDNFKQGHPHPLTLIIEQICSIFTSMGFEIVLGPEVESEYYNFDALNIPADHLARDLWDTFWLEPRSSKKLLRTHTSPVQIRYMEKHKPPLRIIIPGKTFRYEATDATHEAQFYQVEGLMVDRGTSLAHLKAIMEIFLKELFGKKVNIRLRPGYFPFVEPGVEVDMSCFKCGSASSPLKGCFLCGSTGWVEIIGAVMVHPKVLENGGINPRRWQGFAFGVGVDRLAMLKYGIDDIRVFYTGDLRFVTQF